MPNLFGLLRLGCDGADRRPGQHLNSYTVQSLLKTYLNLTISSRLCEGLPLVGHDAMLIPQESGSHSSTQVPSNTVLRFRIGAYSRKPRVVSHRGPVRAQLNLPQHVRPHINAHHPNRNLIHNNSRKPTQDQQNEHNPVTFGEPKILYEPFWIFPTKDNANTRSGVQFCKSDSVRSRATR
ncbi:uncharacterized protein Z520_11074 [Fonsecaea multimorphosa CBS 102226]|uniref:Uncharacterized protein n=1 Tax=Fonsecaea multimorphosa CBS 102226 TaxID=1442371 RepID=A0A0D2JS03_9EURO|nr:uncharacterized protein Z520_11074 [Fonsecaea multimorphosa CBS 102226]KIX93219.1 hypothetical protein Z520_11074 [Fonsecaea multimorphosa CBS 102226]